MVVEATDAQPAVASDIPGAVPEPMSTAAAAFIHLARWVAAFTVLLYHVGTAAVSVPDIMSAPHAFPAYVWWFVTPYAFAHEAVVVFFVLSGFLVGGGVFERRAQTRPWLAPYAIDRLSRIYVVLLPALALTGLCDFLGRTWFPDSAIYDLSEFVGRFDLSLIVPNLLSLQGLWFEPLGTNDPLWSLGMEVWYYLLFPLLLLPWLRAYPRHGVRVVGLAFAFAFLLALPSRNYAPFGFCIWALGVTARALPRPLIRSRWLALALFAIVSIVIRLTVRPPLILELPIKYLVDGVDALLFANLLLTLRCDASRGFRWTRSAVHERLAGFSYTLYAVHVPMLFLLLGAIGHMAGVGWRRQPATPLHYMTAGGLIALLCVIAWGLSRITEARTAIVRRALKRRLLPATIAPPDGRLAPP